MFVTDAKRTREQTPSLVLRTDRNKANAKRDKDDDEHNAPGGQADCDDGNDGVNNGIPKDQRCNTGEQFGTI